MSDDHVRFGTVAESSVLSYSPVGNIGNARVRSTKRGHARISRTWTLSGAERARATVSQAAAGLWLSVGDGLWTEPHQCIDAERPSDRSAI